MRLESDKRPFIKTSEKRKRTYLRELKAYRDDLLIHRSTSNLDGLSEEDKQLAANNQWMTKRSLTAEKLYLAEKGHVLGLYHHFLAANSRLRRNFPITKPASDTEFPPSADKKTGFPVLSRYILHSVLSPINPN